MSITDIYQTFQRGTKRAKGAVMGQGSIGHLTDISDISDMYLTSKGLINGSKGSPQWGHNCARWVIKRSEHG